jgi:hypothetical protein
MNRLLLAVLGLALAVVAGKDIIHYFYSVVFIEVAIHDNRCPYNGRQESQYLFSLCGITVRSILLCGFCYWFTAGKNGDNLTVVAMVACKIDAAVAIAISKKILLS